MKDMDFLVNPRGRKKARRKTAPKKTARRRAARKAVTRKRSRRNPATGRAVPKWIKDKGFNSWGAYMASIRPNSKKGGTVARRKRGTARRRSVAKRRPARRRYRRNPVGGGGGFSMKGLMNTATQGAIDAAEAIVGKSAVRFVRSTIGQQAGTTTGSIVEVLAGIGGGIVLRRMNPNFSKMFVAGAFMAPMETIIKQLNVPILSSSLGDDGTLNLIGGDEDLGSYLLPAGSELGGEYSEGLGDEYEENYAMA